MSIATRYEIAYEPATGNLVPLGYSARKSGIGLLAFVQGSARAQKIVDAMPADVTVQRRGAAWTITTREHKTLGRFVFTGRTQREAEGPGVQGVGLSGGRLVAR